MEFWHPLSYAHDAILERGIYRLCEGWGGWDGACGTVEQEQASSSFQIGMRYSSNGQYFSQRAVIELTDRCTSRLSTIHKYLSATFTCYHRTLPCAYSAGDQACTLRVGVTRRQWRHRLPSELNGHECKLNPA